MSVNVNVTYLSTSLVQARASLESILREPFPVGTQLKVGISVNPIGRVLGVSPTFMTGGAAKLHGKMNRDYRWGVTALYFLFETSSYGECQAAERALIERLWELAPGSTLNEVGGGGGRRPVGHRKYFVYLARG
ncbi:hypothetical protein [Enhygromyxa salina]|uniref:Uncharacterized protein n=1 Tax=Enhygromyxa salina TaxID=215803 RepID=A0A2S9Y5U3_9BACT|nr:hypothetical protein [Enhygromyxa salina]PRQ00473.1 hypothetical protein ENSA7_59670 [Enhygromyxa salina]